MFAIIAYAGVGLPNFWTITWQSLGVMMTLVTIGGAGVLLFVKGQK